ncbi:MAG TPA: aldo/keto reductase [Anaerolineales bacterium]|nr:aldo/keto reductase [Anaerolineales bacterium]
MKLGRTEVEVNSLGVGAWAWGDRMTWGYGRDYGKSEVRAAYDASRESGLDFFDTAEIYGMGRSERLLGEFVRSSDGSVVATKFFPYPWRFGPGSILGALRGSLHRLGLPRVGLYQIHWPSPAFPAQTLAQGLARIIEVGLAQAVGVSNFSPRQTREVHRALEDRGIPLASNQIEYSLLERRVETSGVLSACRELGVTVIAYSPLAMGLLSGKYTPTHPMPLARRRAFPRMDLRRLQKLIGALREVGQAHAGKTASQVALNWVMAKGALPIPGAKNAAQARENAGASGWTITPDEACYLERAADEAVRR